MQLNAAMALTYGVVPAPERVLLVVGLRQGPAHQEQALDGVLQAHAVDLRGHRQTITLRQVRHGRIIDHVGVVEVDVPDTLRFFIDARPAGQPPLSLHFHRDFFR